MEAKRDFQYSASDRPWLERYEYYQNHYDLLPFWYASRWLDFPLAQGAAGDVNINIGHPFWCYDISWRAQQQWIEQPDPPVMIPLAAGPAMEVRLQLGGDQAWGSWVDAMVLGSRAESVAQYGEGYILERSGFATVEYRRVVGENPEDVNAQQIQFILHGCQIWPKGSLTTPGGWRNQTMADWSQKAILQPYRYAARIPSRGEDGDIYAALGSVPLRIRTRDRHFIWQRMYLLQYSTTEQIEQFGMPYYLTGSPIAMTMLIQDIPVHGPALGGIATYAFNRWQLVNNGLQSDRSLRIPRLISPNSLIEIQAGFWQWATPQGLEGGDVFVVLVGDEPIADDRKALERKFDLS